jgi:hypothetical protein
MVWRDEVLDGDLPVWLLLTPDSWLLAPVYSPGQPSQVAFSWWGVREPSFTVSSG